jgi:hypothetical protein
VESAIKECEQLSGVVCKPNKYHQHGTITTQKEVLVTELCRELYLHISLASAPSGNDTGIDSILTVV